MQVWQNKNKKKNTLPNTNNYRRTMSAPKHEWSLVENESRLRIENLDDSVPVNVAAILSAADAERLVEGLRSFELDTVGTSP